MPLRTRLREVEFHHVDLAVGYGFATTPERLAGEGLRSPGPLPAIPSLD